MNHTPVSALPTLSILSILLLVAPLSCSKHDDAAAGGSPAANASAAPSASTAVSGAATPTEAPATGGGSFGSGFEGALTMHMTTDRGAHDLSFLTKGGKLRLDMAAPGASGQTFHVIFDPAAQSVTTLMDAQHMAMQTALPAPSAAAAAAGSAKTSKLTRTGKHETVAGYDCEDWDVTTERGNHASTCIATGLAFFNFQGMSHGAGGSWMDELRDKNGFPLRAVETDAAGKEVSRMEVTKVEKKPVDDASFVVPAGYKMMQMPSFGGGLPHGMPPGH